MRASTGVGVSNRGGQRRCDYCACADLHVATPRAGKSALPASLWAGPADGHQLRLARGLGGSAFAALLRGLLLRLRGQP